ncbi:hypothetical protein [Pelagibacterium sp.]|uniref:hypothetical protein n=1 Tax=Pelagibacterium sp. TaxID=1967288 RepID=UPI003A947A38
MEDKTGGPAFPSEGGHKFVSGNEIRKTLPSPGISVRDYFAAHAPITMADAKLALEDIGEKVFSGDQLMEMLAQMRGLYADAMLADRTK